MKENEWVALDPEVLGGAPVFRGTRVPVQTLFDYLERDYTLSEFLECFPSVSREMACQLLKLNHDFRDNMKALSSITDRPKLLADPLARIDRARGLQDPHMKPLSKFVSSLRQEIGDRASIPDFDPWDAGINAEILFLLEAPGRKAVSSGFISRNNPDETAKNFFELTAEASITRGRSVVWNIVPWYIGTGSKIRPAKTVDVASGSSTLVRLLGLLPLLRVIVLLGRKAEYAESIILPVRPHIRILKSPHPSPLFVNNAPGNRDRVLAVFREAAAFLK